MSEVASSIHVANSNALDANTCRSATPSSSESLSSSSSSTATASRTATGTPSPTPTAIAWFAPTNIAVLRVYNGGAALSTTCASLYIDEVDPKARVVVKSMALPTVATTNNICTLPGLWPGNSEGSLGLSADGKSVLFACRSCTVNSSPTGTLAVVGRMHVGSSVFTNQRPGTTNDIGGVAFDSVSSGSPFIIASASDGVRSVASGATTSTVISSTIPNVRYVQFYNDTMYAIVYGAINGVATVGSGWPSTSTTTKLLPGFDAPALRTPRQFVFENATQLWVTDIRDSRYNVYLWSAVGGMWTETAAVTVNSVIQLPWLTGREETGEFVLYLTGRFALYSYNTATGSIRLISKPIANAEFRGVVVAPADAALPQPSTTAAATPSASMTRTAASVTGTPSSTEASTATRSPTPSGTPQPQSIATDNILVVRAGNGTYTTAATGYQHYGFVDEYTVNGALVRTMPFPTVAGGNNVACTLQGSFFARDSIAQLSVDGRYVVVPCYNMAISTAMAYQSLASTYPRVIARLRVDGTFDTSTRITDTYSYSHMRTAVSFDGQSFIAVGINGYLGSTPTYDTYSGVRAVALGSTVASTAVSTWMYYTSHIMLYNNTLFGSITAYTPATIGYIGIVHYGTLGAAGSSSADPYQYMNLEQVATTGSTGTLGAFCFEALGIVFVLDVRSGISQSLFRYAKSASTGIWSETGLWSPPDGSVVQSVTSKTIGSAFTLLMATGSTTTQPAVYTFVPVSGVWAVIARGIYNVHVYKSAVFAPVDAAAPNPTPSPTVTPSASVAPNLFAPTDLLVLRVGTGSYALSSNTMDTVVDVYDTTSNLYVRSVPLPTTSVLGGQQACVQTGSSMYPSGQAEGHMTLSPDGTAVSFICWAAPGYNFLSYSYNRVLAVIHAQSGVDTRTFTGETLSYPVTALVNTSEVRNAWSGSSNFYLRAQVAPGVGSTLSSAISTNTIGIRYLTAYGGQMYAAAQAAVASSFWEVAAIGNGMPTAGTATMSYLPGLTPGSRQVASFAFESSTVLWTLDNRVAATQLYRYAMSGGLWLQTAAIVLAANQAFYYISSRLESGAFVLYCGHATLIVRCDATTGIVSKVAAAAKQTQFRGISVPPLAVSAPAASITPSATPTPSNTGTSTRTQTPTSTITRLGTSSPTPTASATPSVTPSSYYGGILPESLLLVRVGTNAATTAQVTYVEEYTRFGQLVSTISLPSAVSGSNQICTQRMDSAYEPSLVLSNDGKVATLGCYAIPLGTALLYSAESASYPRVVASIKTDRSFDTTTRVYNAFDNNYFRGVSSYTAGAGYFATSSVWGGSGSAVGMRYVANAGSFATVTQDPILNLGPPRWYNDTLYAACSQFNGLGSYSGCTGIASFGAPGRPPMSSTTAANLLWMDPLTVTGTSPYPLDFAIETPTSVWIIDVRASTTARLFRFTRPTASSQQWSETAAVTIPNSFSIYTLAGRYEDGAFVLYLPAWTYNSGSVLYRYYPTNNTFQPIVYGNTTKVYKAVSFAPVDTAAVTPTPSVTPSASNTATPAVFAPGSVVVLRVGNGVSGLTTNTASLCLDVYDAATGVLLNSLAVPTVGSGSNYPCTLVGAAVAAPEGMLKRSTDGRFLSFACIGGAVGLASPATGYSRVVATVDTAGRFTTSTITAETSSTAYGAVLLPDTLWTQNEGKAVYFGSNNPLVCPWTQTVTQYTITTAVTNARSGTIYDGALFVSSATGYGGISQISGTPTTFWPGQAATQLPGFDAYVSPSRQIYDFVFETPQRLWVADWRDTSAAKQLFLWTADATGFWNEAVSFTISAGARVWGMDGRVVNGVFVLFCTTPTQLFRFDTTTGVSSLIAAAFANTAFRGVAIAPSDGMIRSPSLSASATQTASVTPSATPTASITATRSTGASNSYTPTLSQTRSSTRTPIFPLLASDSYLVVRVLASGAPYLSPTQVEEYSSDGVWRRTLSMPTTFGSACMLSQASNYFGDGKLARAGNGASLSMACYDQTAGYNYPYLYGSSTMPRLVAHINVNAQIDTSTRLTTGFDYSYVRVAVSWDDTAFWAGAGLYSSYTAPRYIGFKRIPRGVNSYTDINIAIMNINALKFYNGSLYAAVVQPGYTGIVSWPNTSPGSGPGPFIASNPTPVIWQETLISMGSAPTPWDFEFETPSRVWVLDSRAGVSFRLWRYDANAATGAWVEWSIAFVMPDGRNAYAMTGRSEANGYVLYITTESATGSSIYKFLTANQTFLLHQTTASTERFRGISVAPENLALPSRTPSRTGTASTSVSRTPTPSSSIVPAGFRNDGSTVVVLRAGNGVTALSTSTQNVYLDEYDVTTSTPTLVSSKLMPTTNTGTAYTCFLTSSSMTYAGEGQLTLSTDGSELNFVCYNTPTTGYSYSTYRRVLARVSATGISNTFNYWMNTGTYPTGVVYNAATGNFFSTGNSHYVRHQANDTTGTIDFASTASYSTNNVVIFNNSLYFSQTYTTPFGVWQAAAGVPGASLVLPACCRTSLQPAPLKGMESSVSPARNIQGFLFEPSGSVMWTCDDRFRDSANVYKWTLNPASNTWVESAAGISVSTVNAVNHITGRLESGQYVWYATTYTAVVAYNTASGTMRTIMTATSFAPVNTISFRGIAFPPINLALQQASATMTASRTPSTTRVATASNSNTPAGTPNLTPTPTRTQLRPLFAPTSIVALRSGPGTGFTTAGYTAAAYIDEYNPTTGVLIRSIPMPTATLGSNAACTLLGRTIADGVLTTSADGKTVALGCYNCAPETSSSADLSTAYQRVMALIGIDGTVDTSTALPGALLPARPVLSTASATGDRFTISVGSSGLYDVSYRGTSVQQLFNGGTQYGQVSWLPDGRLGFVSQGNTRAGVLVAGDLAANTNPIAPPSISRFLPLDYIVTSGSATAPYGFYVQNSTRVWLADVRASVTARLFSYDLSPETSQWVETVALPTPCGWPLYAIVGRTETGLGMVLYFSTYLYGTGSRIYQFQPDRGNVFKLVTSSGSTQLWKSVAFPPIDVTGPSGTPSPTPSRTPTSMPAAFRAGNIVVLRVGVVGAGVSGGGTALFVDEIDVVSGARGRTISLPTAVVGSTYPLMLNGYPYYNGEGQLYRSADGLYVSVAGYAAPLGVSVTGYNRVVGTINAAGVVDTRTLLPDTGFYPIGAVVEGNEVWTYGPSGSRWTRLYSTATPVPAFSNSQTYYLTNYGGQLYSAMWDTFPRGVAKQGNGLTSVGTSGVLLPGFTTGSTRSVYAFVFQSPAVLWTVDVRVATAQLYKYTWDVAVSSWIEATAVPVCSVTSPSGYPQLWSATGAFVGADFIIYGANIGAVYAVNTTSLAVRTLFVAETTVQLRGVAMAPINPAQLQPSTTRSPSASESGTPAPPSQTATRTPSRGASVTPTPTRKVEAFAADAINVLRASVVSSAYWSYAWAGYIDSIDPSTGTVLQTFALPQSTIAPNYQCALVGQQAGTHMATLSVDKRFITVPCYVNTPNTLAQPFVNTSSTYGKSVARIAIDGSIDTTTRYTVGHDYAYLLSAPTLNGNAYYVTGHPYTGTPAAYSGGVRLVYHGTSASVNVWQPATAQYGAGFLNGTLIVSAQTTLDVGLYALGSAYSPPLGATMPTPYLMQNGIMIAGTSPGTYAMVYENATRLWLTDVGRASTTASLFAYDIIDGTWRESVGAAPPTGVRAVGLTGRLESPNGYPAFILYVTTFNSGGPSHLLSFNCSSFVWRLIKSSPDENTQYKSVVLSPVDASALVPTPTPTPSPSATPNTAAFAVGNLLVARVGSTTSNLQQVYLDEVDSNTGATVRTITVTQGATVCGLQGSGPYSLNDGDLSRSPDGRFVTLLCRNVVNVADSPSHNSLVAVIDASGAVDLTTVVGTGDIWHTAATVNGQTFYVGGYNNGQGIRMVRRGAESGQYVTLSTAAPASYTSNLMVGPDRTLYFSTAYQTDGIVRFNPGLPMSDAQMTMSYLPGFDAPINPKRQPTAFAFQDQHTLWVCDIRNYATASIFKWVSVAGTWIEVAAVKVSSTYVRWMHGDWYGTSFIIFATTATSLYKYNTTDSSMTQLATAPADFQYRGVAQVPVDATFVRPSASPSSSLSATASVTPSNSASPSEGASPSSTASVSASVTATATPLQPRIGRESIMVMRAGSASYFSTAYTAPLFVDEIAPSGSVVNTWAVPTAATGLNQICTLPVGADDGFMSLAGDGKSIVWGCYATTVNTNSPFYYGGASYYRVAARMRIDGSIDTSAWSKDAFYYNYLRGVASQSTSTGFAASGSYYSSLSYSSIRYFSAAPNSSSLSNELSPTQFTQNCYALQYVSGRLHAACRVSNYVGILQIPHQADTMPTGSAAPGPFIPRNILPLESIVISGTNPAPRNFWVDSANGRIWLLDQRSSLVNNERLFLYRQQGAGYVEGGKWATPNTVEPYGIIGRLEQADYVLYVSTAGTAASQSAIFKFNATSMAWVTTTPWYTAGSYSWIKSISFAPYDPMAPTSTASATVTPSNTPVPQAFLPGNLLLLRAGGLGYTADDYTVPVFVDELSPATNAAVQTRGVPVTTSGGEFACTIPAGSNINFYGYGHLTMSHDGRFVTFACPSAVVGAYGLTASVSAIGVISSAGTVSTSAQNGYLQIYGTVAFTSDANQWFWSSSASTGVCTTYRNTSNAYITPTGSVAAVLKHFAFYNGTLFASAQNYGFGGVVSLTGAVSMPFGGPITVAWLPGHGIGPTTRSPHGFVMDTSMTSMWVCDSRATSTASVYLWTRPTVGDPWSEVRGYLLTPTYIVTGIASAIGSRGQTVLYAVGGPSVYTLDTTTEMVATVYTAAGGVLLRGISQVPVDLTRQMPSASRTQTPTQTATRTGTASPSPTASLSQGVSPSRSVTPSRSSGPVVFGAGSILVLRAGDGLSSLNINYNAQLALMEYNAATGLQVGWPRPLPMASFGTNRICALPGATTNDGYLELTPDGSAVTLACYDANAAAFQPYNIDSASVARVVARVTADGTVDTSTRITDGFRLGYVRAASAHPDGSGYYVAGAPFQTTYNPTMGVRWVAAASTGASVALQPGSLVNANSVLTYRNTLYVTSTDAGYRGLQQLGPPEAPPRAVTGESAMVLPLAAMPITGSAAASNPGSFCFQNVSRLWLADNRGSTTLRIFYYDFSEASQSWRESGGFPVPNGHAVQAMACRDEAVAYALYVTTWNSAVGSSLYSQRHCFNNVHSTSDADTIVVLVCVTLFCKSFCYAIRHQFHLAQPHSVSHLHGCAIGIFYSDADGCIHTGQHANSFR